MGKKFSGVSQTMSRFRGWIQAGATLLTNLHLPNFLKGGLYQGAGKTVCVPGLNCYSCPGALGSCPIGALQAVLTSRLFGQDDTLALAPFAGTLEYYPMNPFVLEEVPDGASL